MCSLPSPISAWILGSDPPLLQPNRATWRASFPPNYTPTQTLKPQVVVAIKFYSTLSTLNEKLKQLGGAILDWVSGLHPLRVIKVQVWPQVWAQNVGNTSLTTNVKEKLKNFVAFSRNGSKCNLTPLMRLCTVWHGEHCIATAFTVWTSQKFHQKFPSKSWLCAIFLMFQPSQHYKLCN